MDNSTVPLSVSSWLQALPLAVVQPLPPELCPDELAAAAQALGQQYLHARLSPATCSKALLQDLGEQLGFAEYYGANLDALYDCLTDMVIPTSAQGWVLLLRGSLQPQELEDSKKGTTDWQQRLLECLEDVALYWAEERALPFRCLYR